jgi:hypothetical protein
MIVGPGTPDVNRVGATLVRGRKLAIANGGTGGAVTTKRMEWASGWG